jgi:hypothetical protein
MDYGWAFARGKIKYAGEKREEIRKSHRTLLQWVYHNSTVTRTPWDERSIP